MMKKKRKKHVKGGGRKLYLKTNSGQRASADWVGRKIDGPESVKI